MTTHRSVDIVFGASGYIGSNLVPFLLAEGRLVRTTSRNIEVLNGRDWSGAELSTWVVLYRKRHNRRTCARVSRPVKYSEAALCL